MSAKKHNLLTEEQKAQVKKLYEAGNAVNKIYQVLNLPEKYRYHITTYLKDSGIYKPTDRLKYFEENKDYILNLYNSGVSVKQMCKQLRKEGHAISEGTIIHFLKTQGITLRMPADINKCYSINSKAFSEINKISCY